MIKYFSMKLMLTGSIMFLVSGTFLFTGCAHLGNENSDTLDISSEKMHQIEPLELKEAPEDAEAVEIEKAEPALATLEISLEQCRAWALENNLDLKAQLIAPTISAEGVSQAQAAFEAVFSGSMNYSKTNTPSASTLDEMQGSQSEKIYTNLKVKIPLRSGGDIEVDLTDTMSDSNSMGLTINPSYRSGLSASISQPLLKGAGKRVNEYSIRLAEYSAQITDAQTKAKAIEIIRDIDSYYWKLYAARKSLDVYKQQYELAKAFYDETETLVRIGTSPEIDLLQTKASVASKLEAIISAENSVRNYERILKKMLYRAGLEPETVTELIPVTEPNPVHYEFDNQDTTAKAIENRMDLLTLELQLAQSSENISYFKNQTLPSLSLQYKYNMSGLGASRSDSYDILKDNDFHDHGVTMQMSIPIGNKYAKSRLREYRYDRIQRLASRDAKKEEIKSQVLDQIDTLEAYWQSILACRQTTIYMDELYKAEKRQYELGMETAYKVLEAQANLTSAQQSEISALTNYQIALVDLAYYTGTLLGAAKVEWEPYLPGE